MTPAVARESNLLEAEHPEQLAEAIETLVEERRQRLVGRIPPGDSRAAGRNDRLCGANRKLFPDDGRDLGRLVARDRAPGHGVAGALQQFGNRPPARLGHERVCVF